MVIKLYLFCISIIFSKFIFNKDEIKSYVNIIVQKENLIIDEMLLLEIIPIKYIFESLNDDELFNEKKCIVCSLSVNDIKKDIMYLFKYMNTNENNVIIVCLKCLIMLNNIHKNKTILKNNKVDSNIQKNSENKLKMNDNDTSIHELLLKPIIDLLVNMEDSKYKNYVISLQKIFMLKFIFKTFDKYEHLLKFNYINVKTIKGLRYLISDRFDNEKGCFKLYDEILINGFLCNTLKTINYNENFENLTKLKTLYKNINDENLEILYDTIEHKDYYLFKDVYFNLIMLYTIFKKYKNLSIKTGIETNHLIILNCIFVFTNLNIVIKKRILEENFKIWLNHFSYKNSITFLLNLIRTISISLYSKKSTYFYNKEQFENTFIIFNKADNLSYNANVIINIDNGIVNFKHHD